MVKFFANILICRVLKWHHLTINTIKIYDVLGKQVFKEDFSYIHDNFYQISLMSEQKGVYIVEMKDFMNNFNTQRIILK